MLFPNLPTKTLGGRFFLDNLNRRNGWKLQKNTINEQQEFVQVSFAGSN
ncbi:hypothetical protein [Brevibacillus choshinensis]|nr:hypothetical protein [Brevibacillus choshinensis]